MRTGLPPLTTVVMVGAAARREGSEMRIGLQIGPERRRYRDKVARLVADAPAAEQAGLAALAPVMLRIAGENASGTILWMADERAIADHVVPRITKAAAEAGRPAPRIVAGVPVALCANGEVDAARERANQVLGHAEYSPNYQRLL